MATTADAVPVPGAEPTSGTTPTTATTSATGGSSKPPPPVAPLPWTICSLNLQDDEYQIVMKHVVGASVGIGMTDPMGGRGAVVKGELQPTGQVAQWNKTCVESERVKEGDCLVGVGTRPGALTSVSGRTYKEIIEQVRSQIKDWEKDGALILRFKRPPPRSMEPPSGEKTESGDKKEVPPENKVLPKEPKDNVKDNEGKDAVTSTPAKKPPLLHSKRSGATDADPEWVNDATKKLDRAALAIEQASLKLKKDWKHLKKDERGLPIPKPEPVRDPDAEIELTEGQQGYLEVLGLITTNAGKLEKLLQFVSKTQKQDVRFVCEVEKLISEKSQLNALAIASQTKKIMRVFLELGEEVEQKSEQTEPTAEQPTQPAAEQTTQPAAQCTVMQRLRPKVATKLRDLYAQMPIETELDEAKAKELINALEDAKEDIRRMLCRDVLGNFGDYLSGKTYNKDGESDPFPFDFDDILVDPKLYRAYLLFLMDAQRYQMLLFWKACYDVSLDTFVQAEVKDPVILRTLQDLYRKYIRGVSAPYFVQNAFPVSFRDQNITNDPALPGALQATCKKIDNELRYDIWSMFLASPHYITLMGRHQGKGKAKNMNARNLMAFLKQQPVTQEMIVVPCKKVPLSDPYMVAVVHKAPKSAPQTPIHTPPPSPPPSPRTAQGVSPTSTTSTSTTSPRPPATTPAPPAAAPVVELRPHRIFEYVIVLSAFDRAEHSSRLCNVKLLRRHPKGDHVDFAMPNARHIAQLCFPFNEDVGGVCCCPTNPHFDVVTPSGLDAWGCPTIAVPHPQAEKRLFTFIMNDSSTGNKLYGAYLLIRAPPIERKAGEEVEENHRPSNSLVAACVMSRIPLVQVLRDALWSLSSHTNHADWLTNPYELSLVPFLRMSSGSLLKPGGLPQTACSDVPLKILLKHLHPNRVMLLLAALLMEKQILIVSSDIAILGLVCECAISELLLPFVWNYLTIPILPFSMLHYLDCPTPFLMGIHTCYLPLARAKAVGKDTVIVNLDEDEITSVTELPRLPAMCSSRLSKTLKSLYFDDGLGLAVAEDKRDPDLEFRRDLISMWAFLLAGWKDFCLYLPDQQDPSIIFDCPSFLNSRVQLLTATDSCFQLRLDNKLIDELVNFLSAFVRSGFFPLFIQQRTAFITHADDAKSGDFDMMEAFIKDGLDGIKSSIPIPIYTRPSFKILQDALVLDPSPSFFEDDNDKSAKPSSLDQDDEVVIVKKPPASITKRRSSDYGSTLGLPTVSAPDYHTTSTTTSTAPEKSITKDKYKFRNPFDTKSKKLTPSLAPEKLAALATVTQTVQLTSSTSSAKQLFKKTFGSLPTAWQVHPQRTKSKDPSSENSRSSAPGSSRRSRDYNAEETSRNDVNLDTATAAYANRVVEASMSKNSEDSEQPNPYEDSINASTWGSQASNKRLAFSPELFIDPMSSPHVDSSPPTPSERHRSPSRETTQSGDKSEPEASSGRSSLSSGLHKSSGSSPSPSLLPDSHDSNGVSKGPNPTNPSGEAAEHTDSESDLKTLQITLNSREPSPMERTVESTKSDNSFTAETHSPSNDCVSDSQSASSNSLSSSPDLDTSLPSTISAPEPAQRSPTADLLADFQATARPSQIHSNSSLDSTAAETLQHNSNGDVDANSTPEIAKQNSNSDENNSTVQHDSHGDVDTHSAQEIAKQNSNRDDYSLEANSSAPSLAPPEPSIETSPNGSMSSISSSDGHVRFSDTVEVLQLQSPSQASSSEETQPDLVLHLKSEEPAT